MPRTTPLRSRPARRPGPPWRLFVAVFVAVFLVGTSGWAAHALWTAAPVPAAGTVNAGNAAVSAAGGGAMTQYQFTAATQASQTPKIAAYQLSNAGSTALALSMSAASTGTLAASAVLVSLWAGTAGACGTAIPASGTTTGTLSGTVSLPSGLGSLAVGQTATLCIGLHLNTTVAASQGKAISTTFTVTGVATGTNWSNVVAAPALTQNVYQVSDPGAVSCSGSGTLTLTWPKSIDPNTTSYRIVRANTGAVLKQSIPQVAGAAGTTVTTTFDSSNAGILALGTIPILVQAVDNTYGTTSVGSAYSIKVSFLVGALGLSCA
ncbi:MAG: hypothetical protein Q7T71_07045 [Herbiconiux sp.]|nr:hypothetical protein [Herbiconiux sp.]